MNFSKIKLLIVIAAVLLPGCSKTQYGIITARSGLILRESPGKNSLRIDVMPRGSRVIILDTEGPKDLLYKIPANWYKVSFNFREGWAFGGFIKHLRSDLKNAYQAETVYFIEFFEYKNRDFEMTVNLCQAIGSVRGVFSRKDDLLKCKISKRDFSGFLGDDVPGFNIKILDDKSIMYIGNDIACGPFNELILYKFDL